MKKAFFLTKLLSLWLAGYVAEMSPFGSQSAQAATAAWVGNNSNLWSNTTGNWTGGAGSGGRPATGDSLTFNAAGTAGTSLLDDLMTPATFNIGGITFSATASAYTVSQNTAGTNGFTLTGGVTNSSTNTQTINDLIAMTAVRTFTMTTGGGNITLGGNISGSGGGVATAGSGTLTLSGSNTYSGDTTSSATVQYRANGANTVSGTSAAMSANSKLVLNTGALVQLRSDADTTFTTSTYNPNGGTTTTIDVGALTTGSNNTITLRSTNSYSVGGSGTMTLNVTGSNADRLVLSSPVTASHVVNSTIWKLNPTTANVTVANNLNSSAITPTLNLDGTSSDNRFTGNISGTEQVTKSNSSTWTLSGSNTYTGTTTVSAGVLQFQANTGNTVSGTSAAMSASSQLSANSGTVQLRADADTTFVTSKLAPTGGATATFDVGAISTGSANSLTLKSTQTWLVGGGPGVSGTPTVMTFNVTGANSDRLVIDSASGQSAQFADSFNTFILNPTTANLTFASNLTTIAGKTNDVLSLSGTSSNNIFSGNISGNPVSAISVTKTNTSAWTLSGSNSYTGATTIGDAAAGAANIASSTANGGKLVAGAADALKSTGSIVVNNGGTLLLAGSGSIDRVNNSAGVSLGTTGGSGVGGTIDMEGLSNSSETFGSLTLSSNSVLDFGTGSGNTMRFSSLSLGSFVLRIYNWSGNPNVGNPDTGADTTQDRLLFTTAGFTSQQLSQITFYSDAGTTSLGTGREISFSGTPEIVPVPEPTTIIGALALLGLIGYRERWRLPFTRAARDAA